MVAAVLQKLMLHEIEQSEKSVPLTTRERTFGQNVGELAMVTVASTVARTGRL